MNFRRRLSLVVAIMSVALGSGQLTQSVFSKHSKGTTAAVDLTPMDIQLLAAGPEIAPIAAKPKIESQAIPSFAEADTIGDPSPFTLPNDPIVKADLGVSTPDKPAMQDHCAISLDLTAEPSAMIGLTLSAPCQPSTRIVLRHAGLAVTGKTSSSGELEAQLPALSTDVTVSARFPDGQTVTATLAVPEAAAIRRFGVQWLGSDAFQLHAFENGADYGEPGDVSDADTQRALAGQPQVGGFLSVLGDDQVDQPMLAEVYTYPSKSDTSVRIIVEAAVTKSTCAREILGETLVDQAGDLTMTDLTLAMPDCTGVGDILVLKNIDPDLKFASAN